MGFLEAEYSWVLFLIQFDNLHLFIGVVKPFAVNVIIMIGLRLIFYYLFSVLSFRVLSLLFPPFLPSIELFKSS
jgi:hypothetical protein